MRFNLLFLLALLGVLFSSGAVQAQHHATIKVTSSAFKQGATINRQYTGEGINISPPLAWSPVAKAVSYALICDDPDAPTPRPWVHWVIFNIPAKVHQLPAAVDRRALPEKVKGARQGRNDFRRIGYLGPMPPKGHGTHRYFFKVYALDCSLRLSAGCTKADLLAAMKGHIIAQGQLMGKYRRD